MGSFDLRISDAHWDHEPFLQKLLIHNETIFRFMESFHQPKMGPALMGSRRFR
jgi:hypothetical protein